MDSRSWRDPEFVWEVINNILAIGFFIYFIVVAELQHARNNVLPGENNVLTFGQFAALLLAVSPLWTLLAALSKRAGAKEDKALGKAIPAPRTPPRLPFAGVDRGPPGAAQRRRTYTAPESPEALPGHGSSSHESLPFLPNADVNPHPSPEPDEHSTFQFPEGSSTQIQIHIEDTSEDPALGLGGPWHPPPPLSAPSRVLYGPRVSLSRSRRQG